MDNLLVLFEDEFRYTVRQHEFTIDDMHRFSLLVIMKFNGSHIENMKKGHVYCELVSQIHTKYCLEGCVREARLKESARSTLLLGRVVKYRGLG